MSRCDYEQTDREHGHTRLLPHSLPGEMGLLSCILQRTDDLIDEAVAVVPAEAFWCGGHSKIFEQLKALRAAHKPIDFISLTQSLRDRQMLEECGGAANITELFTFRDSPDNWRHYAEIVLEKLTLRQTIIACHETTERCYREQDQVKELVDEHVTKMLEVQAGRGDENTIVPARTLAVKAIEEIEYAYQNRGGTVGTPTGFVDLDRMMGGWQKGMTYYIGARPAMGKSSLGLAFAEHVSAHSLAEGCPVLFFSLEMTGVQLVKRLIGTLAEINLQRARDGFLSKERDFAKLQTAARQIARSRLWVDESAALTIADFRARARRFIKAQRRQNGERTDGKPEALLVIDYLQRMKGSSKRAEDARYLELQEIAQGISQTAKEMGVPIIILAQLKRPKDKRPDTEPDMSEFRECGDIEQEAHFVGLLHRPHYYVKHNEDKQKDLASDMEQRFKYRAQAAGKGNWEKLTFTTEDLARYAKLIIDKQREGPVGPVDLRFIADHTRFETWDPETALYSNNADNRQARSQEDQG